MADFISPLICVGMAHSLLLCHPTPQSVCAGACQPGTAAHQQGPVGRDGALPAVSAPLVGPARGPGDAGRHPAQGGWWGDDKP